MKLVFFKVGEDGGSKISGCREKGGRGWGRRRRGVYGGV